jgi:hypothetical protein
MLYPSSLADSHGEASLSFPVSLLTGSLYMSLELSTAGGNFQIFITVYVSAGLSGLSLDWKM